MLARRLDALTATAAHVRRALPAVRLAAAVGTRVPWRAHKERGDEQHPGSGGEGIGRETQAHAARIHRELDVGGRLRRVSGATGRDVGGTTAAQAHRALLDGVGAHEPKPQLVSSGRIDTAGSARHADHDRVGVANEPGVSAGHRAAARDHLAAREGLRATGEAKQPEAVANLRPIALDEGCLAGDVRRPEDELRPL